MADAQTTEMMAQGLDDLIAEGDKLIGMAASADSHVQGGQLAVVMGWVARAGHIIRTVARQGSLFDAAFVQARSDPHFTFIHSGKYGQLCEIQGALQGLKQALEAGFLHDLRQLVRGEVFADFLEMAEHLLSEGYKDASAVLISGVLEDALRKLTEASGLPLTGPQGRPLTIDPLNVGLAKAGVYQALTKKQITSWAELRNRAAHGEYDKYTAPEVKEMLLFVQRFCGDHMQ